MTGDCPQCGPTGPYLETHFLVAVMNGDEEHARELLKDSMQWELRELGDQLVTAADLINELRTAA